MTLGKANEEVSDKMLYAVAISQDGFVGMTVFEEGKACSVVLNPEEAKRLSNLLIGQTQEL